jgi:hypothetical protein
VVPDAVIDVGLAGDFAVVQVHARGANGSGNRNTV